jgi:hypothetical protein
MASSVLGSGSFPSISRGYFATKMKAQFFNRRDTLEMDLPTSIASADAPVDLICSFSGTDLIAYSINNCLTISKLSTQSEEIIDLEFESNINIISWDSRGRCLILADAEGSLHLITSKGQILFSKKITTGKSFAHPLLAIIASSSCFFEQRTLKPTSSL